MRPTTVAMPLRFLLPLLAVLLHGCASYQPAVLTQQDFLARAVSQTEQGVTVSMAVPDASETEALTGLDLYKQGIQPVWVRVENTTAIPMRASLWSLDRDYFSPIEVAYMNRRKFSGAAYRDMERWFHEHQFPRYVPAGATVQGLVYTNYFPGTRGFNFDLISSERAQTFTMFVPMPGFRPDHANVNFQTLYDDTGWQDVDRPELVEILETGIPCCANMGPENAAGAPFNVVLIGKPGTLRRALLRGQWQETSAERDEKGVGRQQRYDGRRPDTIFTRPRQDGNEKLVLNLWLTRWRVEGENVWLAQTYYWSDSLAEMATQAGQRVFRDTELFQWFARESIAADLDAAARFLAQNFWYNQSIKAVGVTAPVNAVPLSAPAIGHGGSAYFTDGNRIVIYLSPTPVGLDETRILFLRHPLEELP